MNKTEREKATEIIENVCDKFCKFTGTGTNGECEYQKQHNGSCYLDDLMRIIEREECNEG